MILEIKKELEEILDQEIKTHIRLMNTTNIDHVYASGFIDGLKHVKINILDIWLKQVLIDSDIPQELVIPKYFEQ